MNLLYLHGLHSKPNTERLEWLAQHGRHTALSPQLNYQAPNVWSGVLRLKGVEKVDAILGFSIGGYLGYYLAQHLGKPTILFNPALPYRRHSDLGLPTAEKLPQRPPQHIILGGKDDVIDPAATRRMLTPLPKNVQIFEDAAMEHRVRLDEFDRWMRYFFKTILAD